METSTPVPHGLPLRVGLVAATLVLVACGLAASGVMVTSILRHSLISRIDQTLLEASRGWASAPRRQVPASPTRVRIRAAAVKVLRTRNRSRRQAVHRDQ